MREMFEIDPVSIALQMRDASGQTYTSYWQCSRDDLAIMADAIAEDKIISLLRDSRDDLLEIINGEEGEEDDDGLCESDTEADSEG